MQTTHIEPKEQENVIASFWMMLRVLETVADDGIAHPLLKYQVEQWYVQWNRITGDNKSPVWIERAKKES